MKNPIQNYFIISRARFRDGNYVKVLENLHDDDVKALKIDKRSWHRSCYGYPSGKQNTQSSDYFTEPSTVKLLGLSVSPFILEKCFFCQKGNNKDSLGKLEFINLVETLLENDLMFTIAEISECKYVPKHGLEDDTSLKWDCIKVKQMISDQFEDIRVFQFR